MLVWWWKIPKNLLKCQHFYGFYFYFRSIPMPKILIPKWNDIWFPEFRWWEAYWRWLRFSATSLFSITSPSTTTASRSTSSNLPSSRAAIASMPSAWSVNWQVGFWRSGTFSLLDFFPSSLTSTFWGKLLFWWKTLSSRSFRSSRSWRRVQSTNMWRNQTSTLLKKFSSQNGLINEQCFDRDKRYPF